MLAALFWAAVSLEAFGACLSLRRRNWLFFAFFTFLSVSDVSGYLILPHLGCNALAWGYWAQKTCKLALLLIIACSIVGRMVREHNASDARLFTGLAAVLAGFLVAWAGAKGHSIPEQLHAGAMMANIILFVLLVAGYLSRSGLLTPQWRIITAGFLVLIGSDLLITWAWTFWEPARHLYPVGVIPAYGMWNWAMFKFSCGGVDGHARAIGSDVPMRDFPKNAHRQQGASHSEYQASPAGMFSEDAAHKYIGHLKGQEADA